MKLHYTILIFIASVTSAGAFAQSKPENIGDSISVDSIFIDLIKIVGTVQGPAEEDSVGLGALDYLSSVYEESDYYTSGVCETHPLSAVDASVYIDGLPEYILQEFKRPVNGIITSPFGLRENGRRMHKGVDISLHRGDSIVAAVGGIASRVGYEKGGYGYFIIVDHPSGIQTRYAHLQRPLIKPGDAVNPGKTIAIGGKSGNSTGPHLHFEIRCKGKPVDPTPLLSPKKSKEL